jgi:hypothetical protein
MPEPAVESERAPDPPPSAEAPEPVAEPASAEPSAAEAPAAEAPVEGAPAEQAPAPEGPPPARRPGPPRRRRRPTAAERHRRVFFARLSELRAGGKPAQPEEEAAEASATEPQAVAPEEPVAETADVAAESEPTIAEEASEAEPAAEQVEEPAAMAPDPAPEAEAAPAEPEAAEPEAAKSEPEPVEAAGPDPAPEAEAAPAPEAPAPEAPSPEEPLVRTARDQARLVAAIERVGGVEVVRQALAPKRDGSGKPLKWAAVCCEASQGLRPGDPTFAAWVRLAATPVREIKAKVPDDRPQRDGRRGGPRRDDRPGGGPSRGPRRDRDDRGRASREDMAKHAFGGRVGAKIVIPGFELDDAGDDRASE